MLDLTFSEIMKLWTNDNNWILGPKGFLSNCLLTKITECGNFLPSLFFWLILGDWLTSPELAQNKNPSILLLLQSICLRWLRLFHLSNLLKLQLSLNYTSSLCCCFPISSPKNCAALNYAFPSPCTWSCSEARSCADSSWLPVKGMYSSAYFCLAFCLVPFITVALILIKKIIGRKW